MKNEGWAFTESVRGVKLFIWVIFFVKFTICVSHLHCSYGSPVFKWLDQNNFVVEETRCKIKNIGVGIIQIGPFCES
jgi:hypothetical protein